MMNNGTTDYHVSEIFESIQGEGNYAGANSLFIRFQLCNLRCTWCDSAYTWTNNKGEFTSYSEEELINRINKSKREHIIFTGGEPALYRIDNLATKKNKKFHVESNGTIIPDKSLKIKLWNGIEIHREAMETSVIKNFNWVISPKLSNSKQITNTEALDYWAKSTFAVFKFIADSVKDLDEIENCIAQFGISVSKVFIALQGVTPESQLRSGLVEEIIGRGYHFSPRLHILLWGKEKGK